MNVSTSSNAINTRIQVLLVDDSAVVRGLMSKALQQDPEIEIVASAANGLIAINVARRTDLDVIVLDVEMPEMDGLTALPQLLQIRPNAKVVMASSLTQRNAQISMSALALGASDYVPKPSSRDAGAVEQFYRELHHKVKTLGRQAQQQRAAQNKAPAPAVNPAAAMQVLAAKAALPASVPRAIAIASSTGGPQALLQVFGGLKGKLNQVPIFITQHMPATFTTILADHITRDGERNCREPKDGEMVSPGVVYMAPGDYHMLIEKTGSSAQIRLNQDPPVNYCRPAADPMFSSLAKVYGSQLLLVVLTGMGQDGLAGAREAAAQGATVIAQDEATSVVWGMPGAVVGEQLCKAVLPIQGIAPYLLRAAREG